VVSRKVIAFEEEGMEAIHSLEVDGLPALLQQHIVKLFLIFEN